MEKKTGDIDNTGANSVNVTGIVKGDIIKLQKIGLDEKAVTALVERVKNELSDKISALKTDLRGGQANFEELIRQKIYGEVLSVNKEINLSIDDIKKSALQEFHKLNKNFNELLKKLVADFNGLTENIEIKIERLLNRCVWENTQKISSDTILKLSEDRTVELHNGKEYLFKAEFDNAITCFERVVAANDPDNLPEAYFYLALAEKKIQPIWDYANDELLPICYNYNLAENFALNPESNSNYKNAKDRANPDVKQAFKQFIDKIETIVKAFDKLDSNNIEYDCFICTKVTDQNGKNSKDAEWVKKDFLPAVSMYNDEHKNQKIKVFFSEDECKNVKKGSSAYNAHIQYALMKSKVMLLVCSKEEYLHTPWVENEYRRFSYILNSKNESKDKIIIAFNGKVINLPQDVRPRNQFQDFNRAVSSINNLLEMIVARIKEADKFIEPHKKYCPHCKSSYNDSYSICPECKPPVLLVDANTYLNQLLKESEQKIRDLDREVKESEKNKSEEIAKVKKQADEKVSRVCDELSNERKKIAKNESKLIKYGRDYPTLDNYNDEEFEINDTVLIKCKRIPISFQSDAGDAIIKIPYGVTEIGRHIFQEYVDDLIKILKTYTTLNDYKDYPEDFVKKLHRFSVNAVFAVLTKPINIIVPESVIKIDSFAFSSILNLDKIELPNSIQVLEALAFCGCLQLKEVILPSGFQSIGAAIFANCERLESITIPYIGYSHDINISSKRDRKKRKGGKVAKVNEGLGYLFGSGKDDESYLDVKQSKKGVFLESGRDAFCENILPYKVPKTLKSVKVLSGEICYGAFSDFSTLEEVVLDDGVTSIEEEAFNNCKNLKKVIIPNSIESISSNCFNGCTNLQYNEYGNAKYLGNETNPYAAMISVDTKAKNVKIHPDVHVIADHAFFNGAPRLKIEKPKKLSNVSTTALMTLHNEDKKYKSNKIFLILVAIISAMSLGLIIFNALVSFKWGDTISIVNLVMLCIDFALCCVLPTLFNRYALNSYGLGERYEYCTVLCSLLASGVLVALSILIGHFVLLIFEIIILVGLTIFVQIYCAGPKNIFMYKNIIPIILFTIALSLFIYNIHLSPF